VILLIILAGVAISLSLAENGILKQSKTAKEEYLNAQISEEEKLNDIYSGILIATNESSQVTISVQDLKTLIQEEIKKSSVTTVPAGTIISYMGNNSPTGYLFCDGAVYNISDYPNLAEQIKTEFGSYNYYGGDGENTFAVPNLQGEFLRGYTTASTASMTRGVATASVGKHQAATLMPNIWMYRPNTSSTVGTFVAEVNASAGSNSIQNMDLAYSASTRKHINHSNISVQTTSNVSHTYAYTSRPTNTSVLYCIKY